jgi:hypothetical protein
MRVGHDLAQRDRKNTLDARMIGKGTMIVNPSGAPLERFPIQGNRNAARHYCFLAISRREPGSTSLESALAQPRISERRSAS